jgi:hypothetical protein
MLLNKKPPGSGSRWSLVVSDSIRQPPAPYGEGIMIMTGIIIRLMVMAMLVMMRFMRMM